MNYEVMRLHAEIEELRRLLREADRRTHEAERERDELFEQFIELKAPHVAASARVIPSCPPPPRPRTAKSA
jgi:uncharacterized coiled-coil DUF342 family protein